MNTILKMINFWAKSNLIRNSMYILLSSFSIAAFGFFFWFIAARYYSPESVGIATVMISLISLVVMISKVGFDQSIIRNISIFDKNIIINTSSIVILFITLMIGSILISYYYYFNDSFQMPIFLYVILLFLFLSSSLLSLYGNFFTAIRNSRLFFIQNFSLNSKIIFIFFLVPFKGYGIFLAYGLSIFLTLTLSYIWIKKLGYRPSISIDRFFLKKTWKYSLLTYIGGLLISVPGLILPVLIINIIGPEESAYFFIVYSIVSLIYVIPNAISISLFVEGSHGESLRESTLKSILINIILISPIVIILVVFGNSILSLFGTEYSTNGYHLLIIMLLSTPFIVVNNIYFAVKKIQNNIGKLVVVYFICYINNFNNSNYSQIRHYRRRLFMVFELWFNFPNYYDYYV